MASGVAGLWRRLRSRNKAHDAAPEPARDAGPRVAEHVTGRAHLVLDDGRVIEADLDRVAQARLDYLARRMVAPPPPDR